MRKLTICIPIYNCGEFIGHALDSILPQTCDGIDVIVYDGGSTDDTPVVMKKYLESWPNLTYRRGTERGGIDADMAKCAGFAQSEYCWLFSGDDVMRPGAISRALKWLERGLDVYICQHTITNKNMTTVLVDRHPVIAPNQEFTANLANRSERLEWFRRAVTTEAFFSFMSSLIVRRAKWESGELPNAFNKSCWGHVARLFGLVHSGLRVCYVGEIWLDQRGENDSFVDKGVVNRYRIAIEGYHDLADTYFGHQSEEAFHVRRVIRREFPISVLLGLKIHCFHSPKEREDRNLLNALVLRAYSERSIRILLMRLKFFMLPYWLLTLDQISKRIMNQARRVLRLFKRVLKKAREAVTNA